MRFKHLLMISMFSLAGCSQGGEESKFPLFSDAQMNRYIDCAFAGDSSCMKHTDISRDAINLKTKNGHTPLLIYLQKAEHIDFEIVRQFLEDGADPHNQSAGKYNSPYIFAIENNNIQLLGIFDQLGADPNFRYSSTLWTYPIHMAVTSRNLDVVKFLLDSGAEIDSRNGTGDTPLLMTRGNNYEIGIELLQRGASIDVVDKNDRGVCDLLLSPMGDRAEWLKVKQDFIDLLSKKGKHCSQVN